MLVKDEEPAGAFAEGVEVVGQLLRYMAWIRIHQADSGQGVRGIIVGREITDDLKLACSGLSNIELFEYDLSVKLRRIESVI